MPKEFNRSRRVGEFIQRELSQLISQEITMPRSGLMVTISGVDVSSDMGYAKVFISVLPEEGGVKDIIDHLNRAAGFLRHHLGSRMTIRRIPELSFHYDDTLLTGSRMSSLIDKAIAKGRNEDESE